MFFSLIFLTLKNAAVQVIMYEFEKIMLLPVTVQEAWMIMLNQLLGKFINN